MSQKTVYSKNVEAYIVAMSSEVLKKKRIDVNRETSDMPGMAGLFETFLRKFKTLAFSALLSPLLLVCGFAIGLSLVPSIYFFNFLYDLTLNSSRFIHYLAIGCGISFGYVIYGFTLIFVVPALNFILPLRLKPWRGIWFSVQAVPWFIHNALTYIVRYTFLEFLTPSPLNVLFYKMMGMKIGAGVVINSTNISDPCLIELGDYVTIGGSAHLMAHYGQKGFLILSTVKIGPKVTIGLKASVMGGVHVGEGSTVKPHTVLLPGTKVPPNTVI